MISSSIYILTGMNRTRKKIYHICISKYSTTVRYTGITIAMILILSTFAFASFSISVGEQQILPAYALPESGCITYDATTLTITVSCSSPVSLTDIYEQLGGAENKALYKDPNNNDGGVWLLNAGIIIDKGATLVIDSKDVKWLKIIADGTTAYPIDVLGSLKIDSVKVTSWNPKTNDYAASNGKRVLVGNQYNVIPGEPRPYITVANSATGTTNITNSEIAYLGYESGIGGGTSGLRYAGGDGSIIMNNNIHHLYFGFYSSGVGGMIIENNQIHHNGHYGFDPHTGTHDMIFRNNTVHDNGSIGVICSLDCYHIMIENNKIYNNVKRGIMFSRNMSDSVARNNVITNEEKAISISESHNNDICNNAISNSVSGIDIDKESINNAVHDNTITVVNTQSSSGAILVEKGAEKNNNTIYSNTIIK
jgi:poly(beta-D-mannuronate) C5 epimerase